MSVIDVSSSVTYSLCRQLAYEGHRDVQPSLLINTPCPFNCIGEDNIKGKIVMRYHCQDWAHIRCSNLECIYRPFSVKQPFNLQSVLCPPINASPEEHSQFHQKQKIFAGMVRFEQSILNKTDFLEELAKDAAQNNSLVAINSVSTNPFMNMSFDLGVMDPDRKLDNQQSASTSDPQMDDESDNQDDLDYVPPNASRPSSYKPNGRKRGRPKGYSPKKAKQQQLVVMDQESNFANQQAPLSTCDPQEQDKSDIQEELDNLPPKAKRGRKRRDPSLPRPSSYKPNGKKRGRPKGYSPKKAKQQLVEMDQESNFVIRQSALSTDDPKEQDKSDIQEELDNLPSKAKRGRKKRDPSLPRPSSYKPTGRKPGRPKGYSPIKTMQLLAEMQKMMVGRETPEAELSAPATFELVQLGTSDGVNYISQKRIRKKTASILSKKTVANLFGSSINKIEEKAILYFMKALLLARKVSKAKRMSKRAKPIQKKIGSNSPRKLMQLDSNGLANKSEGTEAPMEVEDLGPASESPKKARKSSNRLKTAIWLSPAKSPIKKPDEEKIDHFDGSEDEGLEKSISPAKKLRALSNIKGGTGNESTLLVGTSKKKLKGLEVHDVDEGTSPAKKQLQAKATSTESKIPVNKKSLAPSESSFSMKDKMRKLGLIYKGSKVSSEQKPASSELISKIEYEDLTAETVQEKMTHQIRTYSGPRKRKAIRPLEDYIIKATSPKIATKQGVLVKDEAKEKDKCSTPPVLRYKAKNPQENARRFLSFSDKEYSEDVEQEPSQAKGILKTADSGRSKKAVRFSSPL